MGLKLHSWGETEAELKSEGLVPLHHMTSEGTMRAESCLAHLGKAVFLGFRKTALPSPHPRISTASQGLSSRREERLWVQMGLEHIWGGCRH